MEMKQKLLNVGLYFNHLSGWIKEIKSSQLFLIDSDTFSKDPVNVLDKLQTFLNLKQNISYSDILMQEKVCVNQTCFEQPNATEDVDAYSILKQHYESQNLNLLNFLKSNSFNTPKWLFNAQEL